MNAPSALVNRSDQAGGKRVAIVQSNYIPWKGYFDLINVSGEFILYDDVQYTRRDWRNRNKIKTPSGLCWLTIDVEVKGKYYQKIREVRTADSSWRKRHWTSIAQNYAKAPYFADYKPLLEELYLGSQETGLSEINYAFTRAICEALGITTKLSWSMDYELNGDQTERLVDLCVQAGASEYISGPAARAYMRPEVFEAAGIKLTYMDYSGYPEYPQIYPPFEHGVSVVDLLLNQGPESRRYMKSF